MNLHDRSQLATSRKKPGVAFWATVVVVVGLVIGVPGLYFAGFCRACRISSRPGWRIPVCGWPDGTRIPAYYWPISTIGYRYPAVGAVIVRCLKKCVPPGSEVRVPYLDGGEVVWGRFFNDDDMN